MIKTTIQKTITRIQSKKTPPPITEEQALQNAKDNFKRPPRRAFDSCPPEPKRQLWLRNRPEHQKR